MKALIIDDELNSRELLRTMLEEYCEGVVVAGVAGDVSEGIAAIRRLEPDLVFLDIEMPGGDGFSILDAFPQPDFQVVFVTGYQPTSVRRLNYASLAYVQKPVDLDDLQAVVERSGLVPATSAAQLAELKSPAEENAPADEAPLPLILPSGKGYDRVELDDILYLEAHRAYAIFHLADGSERLASHPLSHYEKMLPEEQFFRVHKSYLVNCGEVQGYETGRGGYLFLKSGPKIPLAVRRKPEFIRFMKALELKE